MREHERTLRPFQWYVFSCNIFLAISEVKGLLKLVPYKNMGEYMTRKSHTLVNMRTVGWLLHR